MNTSTYFIGHSDFHDQTTVHPAGLMMLIVLGLAMIALPRNRAMIALLACASFIAVGQRIVLFSLDFNFMKLMLIFGWTRIVLRQESRSFRFNRLDYWFVAWGMSSLCIYVISHGASGVLYKLGTSLEAFGMYFLVRMLIRDVSDVRAFAECIAVIALPVAALFLYEYETHYNLFAFLGGVPETTVLREGKFRCQGAYSHPILAGCFWAALLPLLVGRLFSRGFGRFLAAMAVVAGLGIVVTCASSTPIVGVLAAVVGFGFLPLRRNMNLVRWVAAATLMGLHMVMKAPVWHLVSRTDFVGGSTGYHRFLVIDAFIKNYHEWLLFGAKSIYHWNIFANDVTNQYAIEGIRGGGLTLVLFVIMIAVAFANVGRLWRTVGSSRDRVLVSWSIGVSLFVHAVNFIGVSYWGQIDILWFTALALAAVRADNDNSLRLAKSGSRVTSEYAKTHAASGYSQNYDGKVLRGGLQNSQRRTPASH